MRLDRPGASSEVLRFASVAEAREAYAAELASRLAAGFVEAVDPAVDHDARLVYADELLLRGDPLGELITAQHELAHLPTADPRHRKRVENRIAAIVDEHHDRWFGALARLVRKPSRKGPAVPAVEVTWQLGFAEDVLIRTSPQLAIDQAYVRLRELPLSRQIRRLVVGPPDIGYDPPYQYTSPYARGSTYSQLWEAMLGHGIPSRMTELVVGADQAHRRPTLQLGELRSVVAAAPALEVLRIVGGHGDVPLASDTLRVLELHDVVEPDLVDLDHSVLPGLEELVLHARTPIALPDVLARFPALVHITLNGFSGRAGGDPLVVYFSGTAAGRLRTLTLHACQLADFDAAALLHDADRFAHLERLDLRRNRISLSAGANLKRRLPNLRYR